MSSNEGILRGYILYADKNQFRFTLFVQKKVIMLTMWY
jgi:hypothetical protein